MAFDLDEDELRATRKMNKADRDEIEVNEYVRTNKGNIGQVIGIFNGHCQAKYHIQFQGKVKVKRQYLSTHTIINHSKQLIDLIEVGDIVNKELVIGIIDITNDKEEIIGRKLITQYRSAQFTGLDIKHYIYANDIKTILTKEQMEANQYVVK